jgi:ribonuclease P/MRP protein subunit RPP40
LQEIEEEKDLGVYMTADLRPSLQCAKAASKAMSVLGLIKRNFKVIDKDDFKVLYNTYTRPHIEYCIQAWSPYLKKDINCLEQVQRRATKLVKGLMNVSYEDRLEAIGLYLYSHERMRIRGYLIETYKILTGREGIDSAQFFQRARTEHELRGHSLKL